MLNLHALLHCMYVMTTCIQIATPANLKHVRPCLALAFHACPLFSQQRRPAWLDDRARCYTSFFCTLSGLQCTPRSIDSDGDGDGDVYCDGNGIGIGDGAAFIDGEAAEASYASLGTLPSLPSFSGLEDGQDDSNESQPSRKRPRCLDDDDDHGNKHHGNTGEDNPPKDDDDEFFL